MTLLEACNIVGIECKEVIADGKLYPTSVTGKPATNTSGRLKRFSDNSGGIVWNWATGEKLVFWHDNTPSKLTAKEKEQRMMRAAEVEKQLDADRAKCRAESKRDWDRVTPPPLDHPYSRAKGVKHYGIRWQESGNKLIVPVIDMAGTLHGLQYIGPEGEKRFKINTAKSGHFHQIPGKSRIVICEGYATGASIHEATSAHVLVAFDAGNLLPVSKASREKWPELPIIIAADNDQFTEGNPGLTKATAAAQQIKAALAVPTFSDTTTKPTDFNDLHKLEGLEKVRQIIEAASSPAPQATETTKAIQTPAPHEEPPPQAIFEDCENQAEETEKELLSRLAKLSNLAYDRVREDSAAVLGIRPATLDKERAALLKDDKKNEGSDDIFEEVEPWPEEINPGELLHTIEKTIRRFIVCNHEVSQAATLWVALTWFIDVVHVAPLAIITAAEKRCGKSQLLNLFLKLSKRALPCSNISTAALFRSIDNWKPTVLLDEADTFLKENEELRGLINSGHTRDLAFYVKTVGDNFTPTKFSTWGCKALCGIGNIDSADATMKDRAIILSLRRKLPHEKVERIRYAHPALFDDLKSKLARFADDYQDKVHHARPPLPESLNDRAQDNWEPLLAIAMVSGGNWLQIGTAAALKISGDEESTQTTGTELLANIKEIFEKDPVEKISSTDLVRLLCADEEWNWAAFNKGYPIKARQLANILKTYDIHSKPLRIGFAVVKGYAKEQFTEAFNRYTLTYPVLSVTELQTSNDGDSQVFESVTQELQTNSIGYTVTPSVTCNRNSENVTDVLPF